MPERKTIAEWIEYVNSLGLAVNTMCQLYDGKWRVSLRVFGATAELAQNPSYTAHADCETLEECFQAVLANKLHRAEWEPKAERAIAAMRDPGNCIATLVRADRPTVLVARAAYLASFKPEPTQAERARARRVAQILGDD